MNLIAETQTIAFIFSYQHFWKVRSSWITVPAHKIMRLTSPSLLTAISPKAGPSAITAIAAAAAAIPAAITAAAGIQAATAAAVNIQAAIAAAANIPAATAAAAIQKASTGTINIAAKKSRLKTG